MLHLQKKKATLFLVSDFVYLVTVMIVVVTTLKYDTAVYDSNNECFIILTAS